MTIIKRTLVLTGGHAGKDITLAGFNFVGGKIDLVGSPADVDMDTQFLERNFQAYPEGHESLDGRTKGKGDKESHLENVNDVEPDNEQRHLSSASLPNEESTVSGGVKPSGSGTSAVPAEFGRVNAETAAGQTSSVAVGDGFSQELNEGGKTDAEINQKLANAIYALDPNKDSDWTQQGAPAIGAVENIYGQTGFTRKDLDEAVPNYSRQIAKDAAEKREQEEAAKQEKDGEPASKPATAKKTAAKKTAPTGGKSGNK